MRELGIVTGGIGAVVGAAIGFGICYAIGLIVVLLANLFFNPLIWLGAILSLLTGIDAVSIAEWLIVGLASLVGIVYGGYIGWALGYGLVVKKE